MYVYLRVNMSLSINIYNIHINMIYIYIYNIYMLFIYITYLLAFHQCYTIYAYMIENMNLGKVHIHSNKNWHEEFPWW